MIKIESNNNEIIISNINILSRKQLSNLKNFLTNFEIFKELKFLDEKIFFLNENSIKSLNILENFFQNQQINFDLGEHLLNFKNQQISLNEEFSKIKEIGNKLKLNINKVPNDFIDEYNEFKFYCEENFPINHTPYENQIRSAFFHLKMRKSCNFSAPGTGKTTIVYSLFSWLKNKTLEINTIFIIGPISSFISWKKEYYECFASNPKVINFNLKTFSTELKISNPNDKDVIYFLNYEKIQKYKNDLIKFFRRHKTLIVLDEAHRIKNPNSNRTNHLREILNHKDISIQYQIILTGTPIPNGYENLFSYFDLLKKDKPPILSKNYNELKKINNEEENKINEIFNETSPFFYSLRKKDMQDFKNPEIKLIYCKMEGFQKEIFDKIRKRLIEHWEKDIDKIVHLKFYRSKLIRLMQIQTDVRMILKPVNEIIGENLCWNNEDDLTEYNSSSEMRESLNKSVESEMSELGLNSSNIKNELDDYEKNIIPEKYKILIKLVNELISNNKKVVIWSNWVFTINKIKKLLDKNKIKNGQLYGGVEYDLKEKFISDFNDVDNKELMVLIANPASVGESISLHKASQNAIYFDINYNVTNHFQSKDRVHRCGMPKGKEEVTYYYLISQNSLEQNIYQHIFNKEKYMNDFLERRKNLIMFQDSDYNNFIPNLDDIEETLKSH